MGLLGDVLPYIYSRSNALKRQVSDFVQNPKEGLLNIADNVKRDVQSARQMVSDATNESVASIKAGGRAFGGPADQKMAQALANNYNPMQMIVWHGSPHKFAKFDSSKIGTGEGAQAYGHGLYLAESPKVAESYAAMDSPFAAAGLKGPAATVAALAKIDGGKNPAQYLKDNYQAQVKQWGQADVDAAIKSLEGGSLYKVDLPDPLIARMLDWDKPLSQQAPEVQSAMSRFGFSVGDSIPADQLHQGAKKYLSSRPVVKMINQDMYFARDVADARRAWNQGPDALEQYMNTGDGSWLRGVLTGAKGANKSGAVAYRELSDKLGGFGQANNQGGGQVAAAQAMVEAGIPGIRYFDGGSRGVGQGTSNFVIFPGEENALRILERNGQPMGLLDVR